MSFLVNPHVFAAAGGGGGTPATLANNYTRTSKITLSNGNLRATRDASAGAYALSANIDAKISGKWYFECTFNSVGATGEIAAGVCDYLAADLSNWIGSAAGASGAALAKGFVTENGVGSTNQLVAAVAGDTLCVRVDMDARTIAYRVNGGTWTADHTLSGTQPVFPIVQLYDPNDQATLNFGATAFTQTVPSGFSAWSRNSSYAGRYWRYVGYAGPEPMDAIAETEHRLTPGGANQISGGTATAHNTYDAATTPDKAIDGNTATYWNNTYGSARPYWWQYDYGVGVSKAITEVTLRKRDDTTFDKQTTILFAYSNDGSTFYPAAAQADLVWTATETKTFTLAS